MATNAERQAAWRARQNAEIAQLRADRGRAGDAFVRAAFAVAQGRAQQSDPDRWLGDDRAARAFVTRAVAAPGSTVAAGWTALVQGAWGDFLGSLSPYAAVPHLVSLAQAVEPLTGVLVRYPQRISGPTGASFTSELGAIPIASSVFALVDVPAAKTLASIIPWSKELSKRSNAEAVFRQLLSEDLAANLDAAILSTAAASASTPQGLLNAVVPLAAFPGADRLALENDLAALGSAVSDGGSGNVVYILPPALLARARVLAPELAAALDLVPSAAVPAGRAIAVDARALLIGIAPPEILFGDQAAVHMSDLPLPIVAGGISDPIRSNWQTATTAIRLLCDVAFAKRRATAVAYINAVSW
jgi:HK97 family phage major capsid protein